MKSYYIHFIRHGAISPTLRADTSELPMSLCPMRESSIYAGSTLLVIIRTQRWFLHPLKRCTQTARLIYPDIEPLVIDQLIECNFGEWENKTADELKRRRDLR